MRSDGTLWLNMGDWFTSGNRAHRDTDVRNAGRAMNWRPRTPPRLKPKDLMLMPHRLAMRLQEDGWWVRQDCVWSKPSPMPESVTDRPTRAHEYVFLLAKSERYIHDSDAVREPNSEAGIDRAKYAYADRYANVADANGYRGKFGGEEGPKLNPAGRNKRSVSTIPSEAYPDAHLPPSPGRS